MDDNVFNHSTVIKYTSIYTGNILVKLTDTQEKVQIMIFQRKTKILARRLIPVTKEYILIVVFQEI